MLEKIEFYSAPDGELYVKPSDAPVYLYDLSCRHITDEMIGLIRDLYPGAFAVLAQIYSKSEPNRLYFEFKIVHRFIRCNFGEYNALDYDISQGGVFNFEDVKCPLRGECIHEGVICKPRLQTTLSPREQEVARLLAKGMNRQEISEELSISIYTVSRHIANIKARLHFKHTNQIVAHYNGI